MQINKIKIFLIVMFVLCLPAIAKYLYKESEYQALWCDGRGVMEYELPTKCRVDCLTNTHAVEFDFAPKWAESIGQSLYYSIMTGKKAGVVLILEDKQSQMKYLERLQTVAKKLNIDVWIMSPESMPKKQIN